VAPLHLLKIPPSGMRVLAGKASPRFSVHGDEFLRGARTTRGERAPAGAMRGTTPGSMKSATHAKRRLGANPGSQGARCFTIAWRFWQPVVGAHRRRARWSSSGGRGRSEVLRRVPAGRGVSHTFTRAAPPAGRAGFGRHPSKEARRRRSRRDAAGEVRGPGPLDAHARPSRVKRHTCGRARTG
jgi:hypothetical protein